VGNCGSPVVSLLGHGPWVPPPPENRPGPPPPGPPGPPPPPPTQKTAVEVRFYNCLDFRQPGGHNPGDSDGLAALLYPGRRREQPRMLVVPLRPTTPVFASGSRGDADVSRHTADRVKDQLPKTGPLHPKRLQPVAQAPASAVDVGGIGLRGCRTRRAVKPANHPIVSACSLIISLHGWGHPRTSRGAEARNCRNPKAESSLLANAQNGL
jgi:hypothetical protein